MPTRSKAAFHSKYATSRSPFARKARCSTSRQVGLAGSSGSVRCAMGVSKAAPAAPSRARSMSVPLGVSAQPASVKMTASTANDRAAAAA